VELILVLLKTGAETETGSIPLGSPPWIILIINRVHKSNEFVVGIHIYKKSKPLTFAIRIESYPSPGIRLLTEGALNFIRKRDIAVPQDEVLPLSYSTNLDKSGNGFCQWLTHSDVNVTPI